MLKVSRWYVGDSAPAIEFDTSFPVKSVRIGVEKNNKQPKKQQKIQKLLHKQSNQVKSERRFKKKRNIKYDNSPKYIFTVIKSNTRSSKQCVINFTRKQESHVFPYREN